MARELRQGRHAVRLRLPRARGEQRQQRPDAARLGDSILSLLIVSRNLLERAGGLHLDVDIEAVEQRQQRGDPA